MQLQRMHPRGFRHLRLAASRLMPCRSKTFSGRCCSESEELTLPGQPSADGEGSQWINTQTSCLSMLKGVLLVARCILSIAPDMAGHCACPLLPASQLNYLQRSPHLRFCFGSWLTPKYPCTWHHRDAEMKWYIVLALDTTKYNNLQKDSMPWGSQGHLKGLPGRSQGTALEPPRSKPPPQSDSLAKVHQPGPQHSPTEAPGEWRKLSCQSQTYTEEVISHSGLIAF